MWNKKITIRTRYSRSMHWKDQRDFKHSNIRANRLMAEAQDLTFKPNVDHEWRQRCIDWLN